MPIYTPRGLKIRLPADYVLALIARLYPQVDAWRVLKTTEGLESIPSVLVLLAAAVCFWCRAGVVPIGTTVFFASLVGAFITRNGLYLIPGLPGLGTAYSYITGFGIIFVVQVVAGYVLVGWPGILAFYVGTVAASVFNGLLEFRRSKIMFKQTGMPLTGAELNLLNAYRLHACHLGLSTDVDVADEELSPENWHQALDQFASSYPEVVARWQ